MRHIARVCGVIGAVRREGKLVGIPVWGGRIYLSVVYYLFLKEFNTVRYFRK